MKADRFLIVSLLICTVVILSFVIPPFYAAALIPAAAFGIIFLDNPRRFLYFYLIVMGVHPLLKGVVPFAPVQYLGVLMGLVLYALWIGHIVFRRLDCSIINGWIKFAAILLGYVALTWLLNRGPVIGGVRTLFKYFSFIPFFVLSINYLTSRDLGVLLKGSIAFFWFNFALNMGWYLGVNPLYNQALAGAEFGSGIIDSAQGTFSSQVIMAYFCVMLIFILLAVKLKQIKIFRRAQGIILNVTLAALFLQLLLTYTNHAYIYFVVAAIPFSIVTGLFKKWWAVLGGGVLVCLVLVVFAKSEMLQNDFSQENIEFRKRKLTYSAKVQLFDDLVVRNMKEYPVEWAVGVGPGNGMGGIAKEAATPFALKMLLPYYQQADTVGAQMSSITGNTNSAIFTLWGDFGIIGFSLFVGMYGYLICQCIVGMKSQQNKVQGVAAGLFGALSMYLLCNITLDVLTMTSICCWVWMFAALLLVMRRDSSDERPVDAVNDIKLSGNVVNG